MEIEIWSDIVCPWCYLGKRRFERALERFDQRDGVHLVYRSFELDPSAPTDATTPTIDLLVHKYGLTAQQANDAQRQMEQRAAEEGLEFHLEGLRSGNTRDAHRLVQLAKARGLQAEMMERLHRAHFSEQSSIFDHRSLADLGADVGLDRAELERVLAGDDYAEGVEADEATARSLGATGVPFFVIDRRYAVAGAQPAEAMLGALNQARGDSVAPAS